MQSVEERAKVFCENPYFQEKPPSLIAAIVAFELQQKQKFPPSFSITLPEYKIGDSISVQIGKIHNAYIFGLFTENKWRYTLFPNKEELKLFFMSIAALDKKDLPFWWNEIENLS